MATEKSQAVVELPRPWHAFCSDCGRSMPDDVKSDVCDTCYDLAIIFEAIDASLNATSADLLVEARDELKAVAGK